MLNLIGRSRPSLRLIGRYDSPGAKDWSEDLHPRDERGRFANADAGANMPDSGSPYKGPAPGSPGALAAAKAAYKWVGDPSAIPAVSEFAGAKTVVDTPEIIERRSLESQEHLEISAEGLRSTIDQLTAEQAGIKQDREAYIVLGIPASAKSSLLAYPLAERYGARLADADIAKEITIAEKDQILAAARTVDDYDQLAPEIRALIAKAER